MLVLSSSHPVVFEFGFFVPTRLKIVSSRQAGRQWRGAAWALPARHDGR
jgi:hypothetical protein